MTEANDDKKDLDNEDTGITGDDKDVDKDIDNKDADDTGVDDKDVDDTSDSKDDDDGDDKGEDSKTISSEEFQQYKMYERLVKKQSEEKDDSSKKVVAPTQEEKDANLLTDLGKQFPQYDDDQLSAIFKITKAVADQSYRPIAEQTAEDKIDRQIDNYATDNEIAKEDRQQLKVAATQPRIKKALNDNILTVKDMYCLLDYDRMKKELSNKDVKDGNKKNQKKGYANSGGKKGSPGSSQSGSKKYKTAAEIADLSVDEFNEYQTSILNNN